MNRIDKDLLVSEIGLSGFVLAKVPWEGGDFAPLFRALAVPD